jgi:alkanesulfonate monooxygenase SsuD/methylene tetrahydromethanopterin reductase-like flavin-dependent oxidoreductase (luciferase family)
VSARQPLGSGSVALGMHLAEGDPARAADSLRHQAQAAERAGFDGVALSEHHGGFPGYLPVPAIMIGTLLAATEAIWGAPCPTVLPLRRPELVVEDLAWLNAAFPGRVGAAFVAGYHARDFELVGADFDRRRSTFADMLPHVTRALRGEASGLLGQDPAVAALSDGPVNVLLGVGGPKGAALAASVGAGLLMTSLDNPTTARRTVETYESAGGTGARVLIRRAWLGRAPSFESQMAAYRAADSGAILPAVAPDAVVASGSPDEVLTRLVRDCRDLGATALNVRIFAADEDEGAHLEQIAAFGADVVPGLRHALGWAESSPPRRNDRLCGHGALDT